MKDGCLNKLIIIEYSHQATQYKKILDVLVVLYADKGYKHVDNVICKNEELDKVKHLPVYPDATELPT